MLSVRAYPALLTQELLAQEPWRISVGGGLLTAIAVLLVLTPWSVPEGDSGSARVMRAYLLASILGLSMFALLHPALEFYRSNPSLDMSILRSDVVAGIFSLRVVSLLLGLRGFNRGLRQIGRAHV